MKKTIRIEGMMCAHCENHVKQALEGVEGVKKAEASHKKGSAVVVLSPDFAVSDDLIKQAVENAGYTATSIE